MSHTAHLMMINRLSTNILPIITKEMGQLITQRPICYNRNWLGHHGDCVISVEMFPQMVHQHKIIVRPNIQQCAVESCFNSLRPSGTCMCQQINHYLNQCSNIVSSDLRNKFQWNLKQNLYIFIQEFENVISKMAAMVILFRPQCANAVFIWPYITGPL